MQNNAILGALASLETYLDSALTDPTALEWIGCRLREERLVAVRGAFQEAFAERMHRCLDESRSWGAHEKFEEHFHYRHHNLYDPQTFPSDLGWCREIFDSSATKDFAGALTGRDCSGPLVFSASWYLPGDYSLPHTDDVGRDRSAERQVAFVWHLAPGWRSEWGGALFWCPRNLYLAPSFNTLVLFNVAPDSYHFVTPVSPYAGAKRLAINGWWTGAPLDSEGEPDAPGAEHLALDGPVVDAY